MRKRTFEEVMKIIYTRDKVESRYLKVRNLIPRHLAQEFLRRAKKEALAALP